MATISVGTIGFGTLGSMQTLQKMRRVINASLTDPLVIETARRLVAALPARDHDAHARAIRAFLEERFQFIRDPRGVEMLSTPRYLLTQARQRYMVQGDCDDAAILGCALAKAVGLKCRLIAIGFFQKDAPLSHVYAIVYGRRWHSLDTTRPARLLVEPPVTRTMQVEV
jgi:transglutaminase-like putative cysteine protease